MGATTGAQAARSDFGGDGYHDLPWFAGGSVKLLNGQPNGSWVLTAPIATATAPEWAETGNFDNDAYEDIAWYANGTLGVFWGATAGGFTWQGDVITGLTDPVWAGTADFNEDSKSDLAWYDGSDIDVYLGRTSRAFTPNDNVEAVSPAGFQWAGTGDFNGDGPEDIAWMAGGALQLFKGTRSATGTSLITGLGVGASGIAALDWAGTGDFDGDENDDVAIVAGGTLSVYKGQGNATWVGPGPVVSSLPATVWGGTGNFNQADTGGPTWDDVALYHADGSITLLRGKDTGFDRFDNSATGLPRPEWAGSGGFAGHVGYGFYKALPPPNTAPGAPQNVTALAGDAEATVTWAAPASDGGSPITGYTVTVSPGGQTKTGTALSASFGGLTNGATYTFTVVATNAIGTGPGASATAKPVAPPPPPPPPPNYVEYVPLVPARLIDTRPGTATGDGQGVGGGIRAKDSTTEITVSGRYTIPLEAEAASLNVTITAATGPGFATVWPCGTPMPNASTLNFGPGDTRANLAISKLGGGKVCVYVSASAHLIADVSGYFPMGSKVETATPARVLDSRPTGVTVDGIAQAIGLRPAESVTDLQLAGRAGIPTNATTVILNVTVVDPVAAGYITVWPCGSVQPNASNVNFVAGDTIPNAVIARMPVNGKVCLFTSVAAHLIVDAAGYFPFDATYRPLVPGRLLDTRPGATTVDGLFAGAGPSAAGTTVELMVAGRHGVPANAPAVVLNVASIAPVAEGFLTIWPCGSPMPVSSNLNYANGQTIANSVITRVGTGGKVCIFTEATSNLLADVAGYYPAT